MIKDSFVKLVCPSRAYQGTSWMVYDSDKLNHRHLRYLQYNAARSMVRNNHRLNSKSSLIEADRFHDILAELCD